MTVLEVDINALRARLVCACASNGFSSKLSLNIGCKMRRVGRVINSLSPLQSSLLAAEYSLAAAAALHHNRKPSGPRNQAVPPAMPQDVAYQDFSSPSCSPSASTTRTATLLPIATRNNVGHHNHPLAGILTRSILARPWFHPAQHPLLPQQPRYPPSPYTYIRTVDGC